MIFLEIMESGTCSGHVASSVYDFVEDIRIYEDDLSNTQMTLVLTDHHEDSEIPTNSCEILLVHNDLRMSGTV